MIWIVAVIVALFVYSQVKSPSVSSGGSVADNSSSSSIEKFHAGDFPARGAQGRAIATTIPAT
jgi:hypothetical protein